jgi:5-methylcytosine-specific restriction protein B
MINLKEFLSVANIQKTGEGTTDEAKVFIQNNKNIYNDLSVEISFGIGRATAIPWIAFLGFNQKVKDGIYPVLLYYRDYDLLFLAYGISETKPPTTNWDNASNLTSIKSYFEQNKLSHPLKYGNSYVFKVYKVKEEINEIKIENDINELIKIYKTIDFKHNLSEYINYWIFQGNSAYFDLISAINNDDLKTWTVKAHKDKIKKGDRIILWLTGTKSGCYALGEVVSDIYNGVDEDVELKYYLTDEKNENSDRVKIKVTYNFSNNPITKSQISNIKELKNLKVGNQGTNFKATEEEYNQIIKLSQNRDNKRYWIYAPGENAALWDEFNSSGIMAIGWDYLGDLSNFKDKKEIESTLQKLEKTTSSKKNDATANYEFKEVMSIGDIVIVKKGSKELLGYGEVTSDYYYDKNRETYQKCRKVDWKKIGHWNLDFKLVQKTLTDISTYVSEHPSYKYYYQLLMGVMESNEDYKLEALIDSISVSGLMFNEDILLRFTSSLLTKPFVILTGLSGSGKTKLAQAFAMWISENETQYKIVPVGADWTNREPLLGFPNGLDSTQYVTPDSGSLELIIRATKEENQDKPYFLILDEMNLSHVERYFADFLSVMESKEKVMLYSGAARTNSDGTEIPNEIAWPKNLFIVGTVNIDETTYMFSPKVLDRANVIEFRVTESEMESYLSSAKQLDLDSLKAGGATMAADFVSKAKADTVQAADEDEINNALLAFFRELKKSGAEFGYRSASEILRFAGVANALDSDWKVDDVIDAAVMQKLLPKVHGSRNKLCKILPVLGGFCLVKPEKVKEDYLEKFDSVDFENDVNIKYRLSFEKICRMYRNAIENGYASYAEA